MFYVIGIPLTKKIINFNKRCCFLVEVKTMYNFNCLYYEFAFMFILIGLGGLAMLISSHFWNAKKRHKLKMIIGVYAIGLCIYSTAFQYIPACINPKITVIEGEYDSSAVLYRGCIISHKYSFYFYDNGGKHYKSFILDAVNKRDIYPESFDKGETYKIYYEERTNIIVKVEEIN